MVKVKKVIAYILIIVILLLLTIFLYTYRVKILNVLSPFFMAVVIAYLLNPLVKILESRKLSRRTSILLLYFIIIIAFITIITFIIPEFITNTRELIETLPQIVTGYQNILNNALYSIQSSKWPGDIKTIIINEAHSGASALQNIVQYYLRRSVSMLIDTITMIFDIVLAMFIAYYFLKDSCFFRDSVLKLSPRKWRNNIVKTGREINLILSNFIQGQLLTALIVGVLETIGLLVLKVKYPIVLGVIGGIGNVIPYFGPFIGAVPAVAVALIQSPQKAVWTTLLFIIVQQIDNSFISPKIIEGRLGLHPVTTIFVVLIGGEFYGIIGMLISVPVAAIIKVIIKNTIELIV